MDRIGYLLSYLSPSLPPFLAHARVSSKIRKRRSRVVYDFIRFITFIRLFFRIPWFTLYVVNFFIYI